MMYLHNIIVVMDLLGTYIHMYMVFKISPFRLSTYRFIACAKKWKTDVDWIYIIPYIMRTIKIKPRDGGKTLTRNRPRAR